MPEVKVKRFITLTILLFTSLFTHAMNLEITEGVISAMPVAVESFGEDNLARDFSDIIKKDLLFAGQFKLINPVNKYLDKSLRVSKYRSLGVDSVLSGHIIPTTDNSFDVRYELIDITTNGKILKAQSFKIKKQQLRDLAHHISDDTYLKLTGDKGVFSTKIVYVSVNRTNKAIRYSLEVSDFDGQRPHTLLVSPEPIMSPAWSPDGKKIAYVSFERKQSQIYLIEVETGKRTLVTNFPGINGAPVFSPDGKELTVVLSKNGSPKLYQINLVSRSMRQLTYGDHIDTEPFYSNDGQYLYFTSNRGGTPQIYKYAFSTRQISRVTYSGNYNARPLLTSNQKNLVMLHRENDYFSIGVQNLRTGEVNPITFSVNDESPTISPNGKIVLYATKVNNLSTLKIVTIDGRVSKRLTINSGEVQSPAWSPYLG